MGQWIPDSEIENWFAHHPPTEVAEVIHGAIRYRTKTLALWFNSVLPEGPTKTRALTTLRDAMMLANASVACDHESLTAVGSRSMEANPSESTGWCAPSP
jgi:hypothetical protein